MPSRQGSDSADAALALRPGCGTVAVWLGAGRPPNRTRAVWRGMGPAAEAAVIS